MTNGQRMANLKELWRDVASILFPASCAVCQRDDRVLCRACARRVQRRDYAADIAVSAGAVPVVTVGEFTGDLKQLITAVKHYDQPQLARYLAPAVRTLLEHVCEQSLDLKQRSGAVLVPVPSRRRREHERGYRHLHEILRAAGVPRPRVRRVLRAGSGRTTQVGLDARERVHNAGRLRIHKRSLARVRSAGAPVIVFDDVTTTGASVGAAVAQLRAHGCDVVAAAAICRVQRNSLALSSAVPENLSKVKVRRAPMAPTAGATAF